jgi:hypothetical protein
MKGQDGSTYGFRGVGLQGHYGHMAPTLANRTREGGVLVELVLLPKSVWDGGVLVVGARGEITPLYKQEGRGGQG